MTIQILNVKNKPNNIWYKTNSAICACASSRCPEAQPQQSSSVASNRRLWLWWAATTCKCMKLYECQPNSCWKGVCMLTKNTPVCRGSETFPTNNQYLAAMFSIPLAPHICHGLPAIAWSSRRLNLRGNSPKDFQGNLVTWQQQAPQQGFIMQLISSQYES